MLGSLQQHRQFETTIIEEGKFAEVVACHLEFVHLTLSYSAGGNSRDYQDRITYQIAPFLINHSSFLDFYRRAERGDCA